MKPVAKISEIIEMYILYISFKIDEMLQSKNEEKYMTTRS